VAEQRPVAEDVQQRRPARRRERILVPAPGPRILRLEQDLEAARDGGRVTYTVEAAQLFEHHALEALVFPRVGANLDAGPQYAQRAHNLSHAVDLGRPP